jgi:hypothetical protein
MERDLGDERRTNVLYECDEMNVCTVYRKNMKNKQKEWQRATKPLCMYERVCIYG